MGRINAYTCLSKILEAVQANHEKMPDEPECDGEVHDRWEDSDTALTELEDALDEAIQAYDSAADIRKSLRKMTIVVEVK